MGLDSQPAGFQPEVPNTHRYGGSSTFGSASSRVRGSFLPGMAIAGQGKQIRGIGMWLSSSRSSLETVLQNPISGVHGSDRPVSPSVCREECCPSDRVQACGSYHICPYCYLLPGDYDELDSISEVAEPHRFVPAFKDK